MTRKSLSLIVTLFAALLLLGAQKPSQASSFGANCIIGTSPASVRVYGYGAFVNGVPNGRIYFGLPNGLNATVMVGSLSFTTLSDGELRAKGTGSGYLFSAGYPIAWVQVTGKFTYNPATSTGTIQIVVTGQSGSTYSFDSGALPITAGQLVVTN